MEKPILETEEGLENIDGLRELIAYIHDCYAYREELGNVTVEDITNFTITFYADKLNKGEFLCWGADSIERDQIWNLFQESRLNL